jgi:hypothetical protein
MLHQSVQLSGCIAFSITNIVNQGNIQHDENTIFNH